MIIRFRHIFAIPLIMGFVVAGFASCEKVYEEDQGISLQTHLDSYALGDTMRIVFSNPSNRAYYYRRCGANSVRFGIFKVEGEDTLALRQNVCQSFNQLILEVPQKTEVELVFRLNLTPPSGFTVPGEYFIELLVFDVLNKEVYAPINHTNRFLLIAN